MYVPLLALAVMSVIAGWGVLNVRDLLQGSIRESKSAVSHLVAQRAAARATSSSPRAGTRPNFDFAGWSTAWPAVPRGAEPERPGYEPTDAPLTESQRVHQDGHQLEQAWLTFAWPVGILLGVVVYARGLAAADRLAALPGVRQVHAWLVHKMYFDELYTAMFVGVALFFARLAGWFDRHVVDGAVNLSAWATGRLSRTVGWYDRCVVDGAVAGVGQMAWDLGALSRSPQTGRVRVYVTALMFVVVIGLAATVVVVMWR
jgi:NADH:ubiquinone oxidoreductase subunit 5 (subunit L)/multisubunit Na+/H+ antiporter MnhA subunit